MGGARQETGEHMAQRKHHVLTINRTGKQAHDKPDTVTVFIQIIKHTVGKTWSISTVIKSSTVYIFSFKTNVMHTYNTIHCVLLPWDPWF